jgi:hypothetical protein
MTDEEAAFIEPDFLEGEDDDPPDWVEEDEYLTDEDSGDEDDFEDTDVSDVAF